MGFSKATRKQGKLRMGLCGPSGSGKTYTALRIATGLCPPGKRVAVVDTERGSASLYAGKFDFDVTELPNYLVETYVKAIREAEVAGYAVVVLDSISHAWAGKGGLLEQVDNSKERNKFSAWRDVTPQHHQFIEAMLHSPCHIIATMRSKMEWVLEQDEKGKQVPRKVGLAPIQRDGMEYEFTLVGDLDEAVLRVSKTRIEDVVPAKAVIRQPGEDLGRALAAWLEGGEASAPRPTPATTAGPEAGVVYEQALALLKGAEDLARVDAVLARAKPKVTAGQYTALEGVAKQRREALARTEVADTLIPTPGDEDAPF